jgi:nicotinamide mononucleotide adenylyltransferase
MKKILAQASGNTSGGDDKYAMFIGRWQPWHDGHRWLIDQALNDNKKVLLCIRDVKVDDKNPWGAGQILVNLKAQLKDLVDQGLVKAMVIPDIESVNIGRGIGYDVIEHLPPQDINDISATKIREQMRQEGKL